MPVVKPEPVISVPEQRIEVERGKRPTDVLLSRVVAAFPWLKKKMIEAGMTETPTQFVARALTMALVLTIVTIALFAVIIELTETPRWAIIPIALLLYPLLAFYTIHFPIARAARRGREIEKDILFAGRHMWISLKGGVPLFEAVMAVAKGGYGEVSKEISRGVEKTSVGIPLDTALYEVYEDCPSASMRRVLMQTVNSIRSGADVANSLEIILDQISREQIIGIREYGQKLNPVVMFYMVFSIIFPSLGITVGIVMLSFIGMKITAMYIWPFVPFIALIQYLFVSFIEMSRPVYQ